MGPSWRSAPTHSHRLVLPRGCRRPELPPVHESCSVPAPMKMNASCSSMPVGISEETAKEAEDNVLPRMMLAELKLKSPERGNRCFANPRFSRSGRIAEQSKQGTRCNVKKLCLKLELLEHIFSPAATQVGD